MEEGVMEGGEGEKGLDAAGKVPINMEITSFSSALHGSLMARRKKRTALTLIILREEAHCQVRWKSNTKKREKMAGTVAVHCLADFSFFLHVSEAVLLKPWWIHLISTKDGAYSVGKEKDTGAGLVPFVGFNEVLNFPVFPLW